MSVIVDVVSEERYWYPDVGGIVWLAGFQVVGADGRYLARDAPELVERGIRVAGVAGAARHHAGALGSEAAAPGRPLALRRDAANEHDPNAIAVHALAPEAGGPPDADAEVGPDPGEQLGWVPRELAAELAPDLDSGRAWSAVVLREQRASPRDPRTGATMLLAPATAIELRVRE
jgi:hypothetical protein